MKPPQAPAAVQRIAILGSRGFPSTYGGYETLVRHLARDLSERGIDVTVYCRTRDEGRSIWRTENVRCVWTPGRDSNSLSTLTYGLTSVLHAATQSYDAALVLNVANGFWLPLLRMAGIPTALNTDGIEWIRGKWGKVARRVFLAGARASARYADVLIADSLEIARIWHHLFGVSSEFIPYGAPVFDEVSSEQLAAQGLEKGRFALVVARLIPENNVDLFLDAVEIAQIPAVVVGTASSPTPLEQRLQGLAGSQRMHWLGHVSDQSLLQQLWAHCGVYCHGHSVGGTNPGLLQALGAGAPTLALDTPFNREVLGASRTHDLFPAEPEALARKLKEVLNSDTRRAEMRTAGRQTVAERYQWEDVCSRYYQALELSAQRRVGE
jgi:glycosyltransferase involved in cell wall biosynthesis